MPKVIQINECLNTSTGRIAQQIGEIAMRNGWDSYITYSAFEPRLPSSSTTIPVGSRISHLEHALETRLFDNHGLASRSATRKLIKRIDAIKPDLIHLHNIHGYYLNYQLLFEYLNSHEVPIIWTLHDCWPFTGHCPHFINVNCFKWKQQCHNCPLYNRYPASWFIDRSSRNYLLKKTLFRSANNLTLVPVSLWLSRFVQDSFLSKFPIKVIHNGIDVKTFSKKDSSRSNMLRTNKFTILGVANVWTEEKGYKEFIELSKNPELQVILVGVSPRQKKDLPISIIGIEKVSRPEELAEIYSQVDLFINPTYADSFPTVNIEALSCGTPVVTYKTGGAPEIIDDLTGIAVECGNFAELSRAISFYQTKTREELSIIGDACRKRAVELFDKDVCFSKYIELYNSLVK